MISEEVLEIIKNALDNAVNVEVMSDKVVEDILFISNSDAIDVEKRRIVKPVTVYLRGGQKIEITPTENGKYYITLYRMWP